MADRFDDTMTMLNVVRKLQKIQQTTMMNSDLDSPHGVFISNGKCYAY